jgi:catechol 2,3-dioxygenase-like lactoylglutathione lyase family enzyme
MDVATIDHVTFHVPEDGVEDAVAFYGDALGFGIEGLDAFEAGEKPFFDVRLGPRNVLHVWPLADFEAPDERGYDHLALLVDDPLDDVLAGLEERGVEIERRMDAPRGATGEAPGAYLRDPFGYRVELKQARRFD